MYSGLGYLRIYVRLKNRDCAVVAPPCSDERWNNYLRRFAIPGPVTAGVPAGIIDAPVSVISVAAVSIAVVSWRTSTTATSTAATSNTRASAIDILLQRWPEAIWIWREVILLES